MTRRGQSCKIVLLGDTAVGKSCIAVRFVQNKFWEFQEPTIGAAFLAKNIDIDGKILKYEIWDTAGQERYRSLAPMYYRGAIGAIVVFDITQRGTLIGAKSWIKELKERVPDCIIVLVANKLDLEEDRKITKEEIFDYVSKNNLLYMETSAKTGHNINKVFSILGSNIPNKSNISDEETVLYDNAIPRKMTYKSCC